jgi:hypothetical protein
MTAGLQMRLVHSGSLGTSCNYSSRIFAVGYPGSAFFGTRRLRGPNQFQRVSDCGPRFNNAIAILEVQGPDPNLERAFHLPLTDASPL